MPSLYPYARSRANHKMSVDKMSVDKSVGIYPMLNSGLSCLAEVLAALAAGSRVARLRGGAIAEVARATLAHGGPAGLAADLVRGTTTR
jgi:hypothetical protein